MAAPLQIDYLIISHAYASELVRLVNAKLGEGYILSGGIAYFQGGFGPSYHQTLVKPVAPSAGGRRRSTRRRR
jgi:hypothetical protein